MEVKKVTIPSQLISTAKHQTELWCVMELYTSNNNSCCGPPTSQMYQEHLVHYRWLVIVWYVYI